MTTLSSWRRRAAAGEPDNDFNALSSSIDQSCIIQKDFLCQQAKCEALKWKKKSYFRFGAKNESRATAKKSSSLSLCTAEQHKSQEKGREKEDLFDPRSPLIIPNPPFLICILCHVLSSLPFLRDWKRGTMLFLCISPFLTERDPFLSFLFFPGNTSEGLFLVPLASI